MFIDFLLDVFRETPDNDAIVWQNRAFSYGDLLERIADCRGLIGEQEVPRGSVVALKADFSPAAVAWFLALLERGCVVVPLTSSVAAMHDRFIEIAQGEMSIDIDAHDRPAIEHLGRRASHDLYRQLRSRDHPGMVLFSSGSTGEPKAALHDFVPLLEKFKVRRHRLRAISFLLYDHIGGINTMLYVLSNGGCMVTVADRSPDAVLAACQRHRVELLPTTPTFLNLILISEAYKRYDLSALQTITYGTEPMQQSTLRRVHELLPHARVVQTYGLSEVGILRSKSKGSDSLWVKIGGEGFQTRVVDGILHIKAASAMLGYLNAPSPFDDDGWLNTGDRVEVEGEYLRFKGRESEVINVGGEKVFPAEVESAILEMDDVADATVHGEKHPIIGQIVCARVTLKPGREEKGFAAELKKFCGRRLKRYKVPVKVEVVGQFQHGDRFKRMR